MSLRVYFQLDRRLTDYVQEIGFCLLAYLDYRLGLHRELCYFSIDGNVQLFIICTDGEEAERIYKLMSPNANRGVFVKIEKRDAYHCNRRYVKESNGNPWHDRYYKAMHDIFIRTVEREKDRIVTPGIEFTRAVYVLGYSV